MQLGQRLIRATRATTARAGSPWLAHNFPLQLPAGEVRTGWLTIENRSPNRWVQEACRLSIELDGARIFQVQLPHSVDPGERVTLHWVFRISKDAGRHEFKFDLVERDTSGAAERLILSPFRIQFEAVERSLPEASRLRDLVLDNHSRCWLPADGMSWSSGGPGYPQFAREARGCRITDVEGNTYVDYLMGWGSALLGYANERVQRVVADSLQSGALLTLTHHLMPEVGETLCQMFPGAEAATFGKNGSDVCTAAVRLARAHTGRRVILFCGYHGWQDWYIERLGFQSTGVPENADPTVVPFEPGNLNQLTQLLDTHRGRVAAIVLEPAGAIEGSNGPIRDADSVFLRDVAALAHKEGALLIFDEIMTGFRYLSGSVQHATGVVPDLTCLGKALGAGMPLSALIGRREIFDSSIGRIHYEPTFKGEVYSFAAAREALRIYREQDVPALVWSLGNRLRDSINRLCKELGVPAEMIGPPYRMLLSFAERNARRRTLMRTLVQQELLRHGVLTTQTLFLPSVAHDNEALEVTVHAFEHALTTLVAATNDNRFASYLEIPPLPA